MDATVKLTNVWRSVKKFFIDGLSGEDVELIFDRVDTKPSDDKGDKWVCILLENTQPQQVSSSNLTIFMVCREDYEGDEVVKLRDTLFDLLYPGRIDLYDTYSDPWEKVGSMSMFIRRQTHNIPNPEGSKMSLFTIELKWGAVW